MPESIPLADSRVAAINYGDTIAHRRSSNSTFSSHLANTAAGGANVLANATGVAAPFVPGSAVLSAALNQAAGQLRANNSPLDVNSMAVHPGGQGQTPEFAQSAAQMQQQMLETNVSMLRLQQQINQLASQFSVQSNILKAKHDAEKNSIANFR